MATRLSRGMKKLRMGLLRNRHDKGGVILADPEGVDGVSSFSKPKGPLNSVPGELVAAIEEAKAFIVVTHEHPDGDSMGSCLAAHRALQQLGKDSIVYLSADEVPKNFRFLPGSSEFQSTVELEGWKGTALFIDCAEPSRATGGEQIAAAAASVINIDHHISNTLFGDIDWVLPSLGSASEMIYDLILALGVEIDVGMATNLYAAVLTDTGSFVYGSTRPETHLMAADLLARGVRHSLVYQEIYENRSLESMQLLMRCLKTLTVKRGVAWQYLSLADFRETGAGSDEAAGLVNYGRRIAGVEVSILFTEEEEDVVRISFRSQADLNVSAIAGEFGGGGHPRAAGCEVRGALSEVIPRVVGRTLEALEQAQ